MLLGNAGLSGKSQSQRLTQQMRKCVLMTEVRSQIQAWCPCTVLFLPGDCRIQHVRIMHGLGLCNDAGVKIAAPEEDRPPE